ncbi:MAG: choice-of-anchor Q domain-containing protein [Solirubrobacteraceae bacterium]
MTAIRPGPAFTGDSAESGGAIYDVDFGSDSITVTGSTFTGDSAREDGGAIDETGGQQTAVTGSTFAGDTAQDGGAIDNADDGSGNTSVTGSTFSGNVATTDGGAIDTSDNDSSGGGGTLTVDDSSFTGNFAGKDGGAVDNANGIFGASAGSATVTDATFADNFATADGGAIDNADASGGTIDSTLTVTGATFAGNSADIAGGAIDAADAGGAGPVDLTASTLSGDSAAGGAEIANASAGQVTVGADVLNGSCLQTGAFADSGDNVVSDASCDSAAGTDVTDPGLPGQLGPLAFNGGPSETIALEVGNPAVGIVPYASGLCPTSDERGVPLASGVNCDAGAVQTPTALTIAAPSATMTYGQSVPGLGPPAYSGFVLGQNPTVLGSAPACAVEEPVTRATTYAITCSGAQNATGDSAAAPDTDYAFAYAPGTLTVNPAPQTITFSAPPSEPVVGGSFEASAAGGASGNPVVCSVDSATTNSACSLAGGGLTVSFDHAGHCVIDANQAGNDDYEPAPQQQQTFTILPAPQAIAFTSTLPSTAAVGGSYVVSATGGASGNPVVFSIGPTTRAECSLAPDGTTVTFEHTGECVIEANQAGNSDYTAAVAEQETFVIGTASQSVTFTSTPPAGPVVGRSYPVVSATATSGLPVTFSIGPPTTRSACSFVGANGVTVAFPHAGECVIDATQTGDSDYTEAEQQQAFAVGPAPQSITFTSSPAGTVVGSRFVVSATGGASHNPVIFSLASGTTNSACTFGGSGDQTVSFDRLGNCVIDATQAGNADYLPGENDETFAVTAKPSPGDRVYWADFETGTIRVASSDGSVSTLFGGEGNPTGVAIDPAKAKIYWADAGSGTIRVGNLDGYGSPRTLFSGESAPAGVAIDPATNEIYWTDYDTDWDVSRPGMIRAGRLDRSGSKAIGRAMTLFAGQHQPLGVTIDPSKARIYWTDGSGEIRMGNVNQPRAGDAGQGSLLFTGQSKPSGVAIDLITSTIYWADNRSNEIMAGRLDRSGAPASRSASPIFKRENSDPFGVAIDPGAGEIYWTDYNHQRSDRHRGAVRAARIGAANAIASTMFARESGPAFIALLRSPAPAGAPAVSHAGTGGQSLICSRGSWAGDLPSAFFYRAPRTFTYRWSRDGDAIPGATSDSYTPHASGLYACTVTAANQAGSGAQTSQSLSWTPPGGSPGDPQRTPRGFDRMACPHTRRGRRRARAGRPRSVPRLAVWRRSHGERGLAQRRTA